MWCDFFRIMLHDFHLYGLLETEMWLLRNAPRLQVKLMTSCSLKPETQKMHQNLPTPTGASFREEEASTRWYTSDHWTLLELDMHHLNTSHITVVGRLPCCQNVANGNNSTISMEFCWRKKTFRGLNKPRNWDQVCQTIQWYKWVCLRMYSLKRVCAFWIDI